MKRYIYLILIFLFMTLNLHGQLGENILGSKIRKDYKIKKIHLYGGNPTENWWRDEDILKKLNLTDSQKKKIHSIKIYTGKSIASMDNNLREIEINIRKDLFAKKMNETKIKNMIIKSANLRSKIYNNIAFAKLNSAKVLTWKQKQKLKKILNTMSLKKKYLKKIKGKK